VAFLARWQYEKQDKRRRRKWGEWGEMVLTIAETFVYVFEIMIFIVMS
jgi:hypothetical protein